MSDKIATKEGGQNEIHHKSAPKVKESEARVSPFRKIRDKVYDRAKTIRQAFTTLQDPSVDLSPETTQLAELSDRLATLTNETAQALGELQTIPGDTLPIQEQQQLQHQEKAVTSEAEKVAALREILQLPKDSPLAETATRERNKRTKIDEYVKTAMSDALEREKPYSKKGFPKNPVDHTKADQMKLATITQLLKLRGVSRADQLVSAMFADNYVYVGDVVNNKAIANLKELTLDEFNAGKAKLEKMGYIFYPRFLKSREFTTALKTLAAIPDATLVKVNSQLDPYFFLEKDWLEYVDKKTGALKKDFTSFVSVLQNGGLTPEQKAKLDATMRLSLLNGHGAFMQETPGEFTYQYTPDLGSVISHGIDGRLIQSVTYLVEDEVHGRIVSHTPAHSTSVSNTEVIRLLQSDEQVPLEQYVWLRKKGIATILPLSYNTAINESTIGKVGEMFEFSQNPDHLAWATTFTEYGETSPLLQAGLVQTYKEMFEKREQIADIAIILQAFPQGREQFSWIVREGHMSHQQPLEVDLWRFENAIENYTKGEAYQKLSENQQKLAVLVKNFLIHKREEGPYKRTVTFVDTDFLPFCAYIARNTSEIDTLFTSNLSPTDKMTEALLKGENIPYNEKVIKFFINEEFWRIADKSFILPHVAFLDNSHYRLLALALSEDIIQTAQIDDDLKQRFLAIRETDSMNLQWLYANYEGEFSAVFQHGYPTEKLYEYVLQFVNYGNLDSLVPLLEHNPNITPQVKEFFQTVAKQPSNALKTLVANNRASFGEYFIDGVPTPAFIRKVVAVKDFENLPPLLSETILAELGEVGAILRYWKDLPKDMRQIMITKVKNFPNLTGEELEQYMKSMEIISLIKQSPSKEIKRLEAELIDQLINSEDPGKVFAEIEDIFIKNNLPLVGKVFRVFETIYARPGSDGLSTLDRTLTQMTNLSPVLRAASVPERRDIIYADLVKVHVDSANPSLVRYINLLETGENLIDKFERTGSEQQLTSGEQLQLGYFLDKMDTLYTTSFFGKTREERRKSRDASYTRVPLRNLPVAERIAHLRKDLLVRPGQKLTSKILDMYGRPVGLTTFEAIRERMTTAKTHAHQRNTEFAQQAIKTGNGTIPFKEGDLLKGTQHYYLRNILENGSVAKEYLGASSTSDYTPLDTDVSIIRADDVQGGKLAIESSIAKGYGDIIFVIKNRGQFASGEYELFQTRVLGDRHYGVRTGFAATEIDAIITQDNTLESIDKIAYTIARNGYYIPIVDAKGKILFTPTDYEQYRHTFDGVAEYGGNPVSVTRTLETKDVDQSTIAQTHAEVQTLVTSIKEDEQKVDALATQIRTIVGEVLDANGVLLRDPYTTSIYGADFLDSGSTGRHTNTPGDIDFDLSLLLDSKDSQRMQAISQQIKQRLNPTTDKSHTENGYIQLRAMGARLTDELEPMDIDIGIGMRSDYVLFASHDAIKQKLDSIRQHAGDDTYYEVLANIVLAKRILKEGKAYKKVEHGGFGGIGVENWILANHGNLLEAFKTFYETAHPHGERISFSDFKQKYKIFDAGSNIKRPYDLENYIENLKETGYQAMLDTIKQYLSINTQK